MMSEEMYIHCGSIITMDAGGERGERFLDLPYSLIISRIPASILSLFHTSTETHIHAASGGERARGKERENPGLSCF
jgi:hypothetical protein